MSSPTHAVAAPEAPAKSAAPFAVSPARLMRLQRACACGGQCDSCKKKPEPKPMLQRKSAPGAPSPQAAAAPHAASAAPAARAPAPLPKAPAPPPAPAKAAPAPAAAPGAGAKAPAPPKAPPAPKVPAPPKSAAPKSAEPPTAAKDKAKAAAPGKDAPRSATPAITEKKKAGDANADLPPIVRRVLDMPGEPLDFATRTEMESRFGHSFHDVRIHTDALAAESARAEYAHAYTVGEHIVFDSGQYRPETPEGKHLLAHELAHTIQQHGLQKSGGPIPTDTSGDYRHLESEAESAARTVMHRPPTAGAPISPARAAQPRLARVASSEVISCDADETERTWTSVAGKKNLKGAKVKRYSLPGKDVQEDKNHDDTRDTGDKIIVAVDMDEPFILPAEKGNVLDIWKQRMSGCNLEAIIDPGEGKVRTKAGLKQERPPTDQLRKIWLQRVGWNSGYEEKWLQAVKATKAGKEKPSEVDRSTSFDPTVAMNSKCQVDHVLELQVGGNDTPENMQMLDGPMNEKSGRDIFNWLAERAVKVRDAFASDLPDIKIQSVLMRFGSIKPSTPICGPCCQADAQASKIKDTGPGGESGVEFPLMAGGSPTVMVASSKTDTHVGLAGSPIPRNKAASTLISGLSLIEWTRKTTKKTDGGIVKAELDTKSESKKKTALPKTLQGEKGFDLKRDPDDGTLKLAEKRPNIKFHYDFLSEGSFTSLNLEDDGSITGAGTITPSFKGFLPTFDIAFNKDKLTLSKEIPKDKFKLPIPGFRVTEAKLGMELGPEFKPEGLLKFEVGPTGKEFLHGELKVSADETGLTIDGEVFAAIPGVDETRGTLSLKNNEWSGGIEIKTTGNGKLKYVKSADISVVFAQHRMTASGALQLAVPGVTEPVKAEVSYDENGWAFSGWATFHPPRLKEVRIHLRYARGRLSGEGDTEFEFHQQKGKIHVSYDEGMFSGKGSLTISTKRAEGSIDVQMKHRSSGALYFTGEGHITFKVRDDLVAGAGVKIDDDEKVTVTGELVFTKPIPLFRGFSGDYTFFDIEKDIPLPPPLSIGGVGLEVNIEGSLSAHYEVGPVTLEDVKATAQFQPLEEDPAVELDFTSRLVVKAMGSVSGTIKGGLKLNAYIASVRGDLGITATAALKGFMDIPFHAHYKDGKVVADVEFHAGLALILSLALIASVEAKAGIGWLSVSTSKTWTLGTYTYDPHLSLGMALKKPIHYESPDQFTLPSVDDIDWVKPNLDGEDAVRSAAGSSKTSGDSDD